MTTYNVYLSREIRAEFTDIEADSPGEAAAIARLTATGFADRIDDGDDLTATVGSTGERDYRQSVTIDFEPERHRNVAPALLAALEAILPYAENECRSLFECWKRDDEALAKQAANACETAIEQAYTAIAEAKGLSLSPLPETPVPAEA